MILEIKDKGELVPVEFQEVPVEEKQDVKFWELRNEEYDLKIIFQTKSLILQEIGTIEESINIDEESLSARIKEFLNEQFESVQAGFDDSEDNEAEEPQPYDPHKIKIRSDRWSISHIFELMNKWDQLELSPDFQRGFVWDRKRKSQLIESLMLRIPVPAFYLAETQQGDYQVVDGLQRLTTIRDFMRNEFSLKFLEYLEEQNGKWFSNEDKKEGIDQQYWRNILQTQLTVNIIEASSPRKVKFDIFRRVNTGGKPLNNQEIRNCLSEDATRKLINELAYSKEFKTATWGSVSTSRMQAQELVLRFVAFWHERVQKNKDWYYNGNMTEYLDEAIEVLNQKKGVPFSEIKEAFYRGMVNAYHLFGKYSFRKCLPEHLKPNARKQLINKSLFTTWSVVLSEIPTDALEQHVKQGEFIKVLASALEKNEDYLTAVSYRTNDRHFVDTAFGHARNLVAQIQ